MAGCIFMTIISVLVTASFLEAGKNIWAGAWFIIGLIFLSCALLQYLNTRSSEY